MAQRPLTFLESEVTSALSFFQLVKDQFASDPAVYEELLRLLRGFSTGKIPDDRAVKDGAYALLHGHPELIRRLDAFFPDERARRHAREYPAPTTRPKRERRPTPVAAAAVDDDADIRRALQYFERVKEAGLYGKLLALISRASDPEADLNQIYGRARKIFGSAHGDLLAEFVTYLPVPTRSERKSLLRCPAKKEPQPEEHRAPAPKRKAAAVPADNPTAAKRPRTDDLKTTTRTRRSNSPAVLVDAPKSGEVSAFREAWEFETTYSRLVATARRTKALLNQYKPKKDAPPPPPPCGRREFDELFPSRECQEVLREMYHSKLESIRDALEDGARTELALRTIKRRLWKLEQLAVKMAMERRDRARVERRMGKLACDRVLILRKNRAKRMAGTCEPGT
jgi:hypothetical protein